MGRQLGLAAFFAVIACLAGRGWGYQVVEREDVDSLYYLSQTIVKAEVGASHPEQTVDGNCVVYEVKVLEVLKGEATVGKTYQVTGLDAFQLSPGLPGRADSWGAIPAGEVVYLFMASKDKARYAMYRLVEAEWTVIDSGAELEVAGQVYGFSQWQLDFSDHPPAWQKNAPTGAQVAMTPTVFPKALVYTEQAFHARIERAKGVQAEVEKVLKVEASDAQIAALAEMLRGRRAVMQTEGTSVDAVGRALGRRLAEIGGGKPEVLDGLYQDADRGLRMELTEGFGTGGGVAYLLEHVADEKAPMEKRLAWAGLLTETKHAAGRNEKLRQAGVPADLEERLARLAVANFDNGLGMALIQNLPDDLGQTPSAGVVEALQEGYKRGTPGQKFAVAECVMQMSMRTYRDMFAEHGMFLTLAAPDRDFAAGLKQGVFKVSFRFRGGMVQARGMQMVLRPAGGGAERVLALAAQPQLPQSVYMGGSFGSGWQVTANVPADLPAGKYEVFLRGDGDGLGFEAEIPKR